MKAYFFPLALIVLGTSLRTSWALGTAPRVDAVVDWAKNKIFLKAEWHSNTELSRRTNAELRAELKSAIIMKLSSVTHTLWMKTGAEEMPDLADFWGGLKVDTFQIAGNSVSATMQVTLRGKQSLMAHLPVEFTGTENAKDEDQGATYEKRPQVGAYDASGAEPILYTGLIIDARHLSFEPGLIADIYSDSGRHLYGASTLSRATAVKRGVTGFSVSDTESAVRTRVGRRPLRVSALDLSAGGNAGLVISEEDAAKIMAHIESVKNLRRARVVILVSPGKMAQKF